MTELSHSTRLAVVGQGEQAGRWQQLLESELARTHNLAAELAQADALVVVIDPSFSDALDRVPGKKNRCVEAIRGALAQGKMLLPVTVGGAALRRTGSLPEDLRALTRFQSVTLDRESSVPGVTARLVVVARAAAQKYVPANQVRRVFISYRRDDCWYWASLLGTALTLRLGAPNVFFDIGSIAPGRRFDTEIQLRLRASNDVVILVGTTFLACDETGRRRLDNPDDFVRREIAAAVRNRTAIHLVLTGDATMPESAQLPADIAPAFRGAALQRLKDHRDVGTLADAIVMRQPALTLSVPDLPLMARQHKEERFVVDAGWRLAELGWRPVNLAESKGALAMIRPDADGFRFVFDFQRFDLVLEERARSLSSLGLKGWVRRARFPFGLDDTDRDAITPSDEQVEAMANPGAYLDRVGHVDLDSLPTPPKSLPWVREFVRDNSQPGRRALDEQARELARIRAKGGLPELSRITRVPLGEDVTAQAVAFNAVTGQFVVASNYGLYAIDAGQAIARRLGRCLDLTLVALSRGGLVAGATYENRLWVLDGNGAEIIKGKTPYSLWQRRAGEHQRFATLSWHADETRIAIGGSDHIWIYRLDSNAFERFPLRDDENLMSEGASALFVPGSEDLVVMQRWTVWRVSEVTGRTGALLNTEAGSDFYDPHSNDLFSRTRGPTGFIPNCIALSADGRRLAVGGNDAQLVLLDSVSLQPLTMRVWHLPLVDTETNGKVEALAFSPDARMLASVANDNRVVIGDARQGDPLAEAKLSVEAIRPYRRCQCRVCWSADGAQVAVTNGEGRIEIFDVSRRERHSQAVNRRSRRAGRIGVN
jgi:WD40 repeat protein